MQTAPKGGIHNVGTTRKTGKEASIILGKAGIEDKNEVLREAAKCLVQNQEYILSENYKDVENAKAMI